MISRQCSGGKSCLGEFRNLTILMFLKHLVTWYLPQKQGFIRNPPLTLFCSCSFGSLLQQHNLKIAFMMQWGYTTCSEVPKAGCANFSSSAETTPDQFPTKCMLSLRIKGSRSIQNHLGSCLLILLCYYWSVMNIRYVSKRWSSRPQLQICVWHIFMREQQ